MNRKPYHLRDRKLRSWNWRNWYLSEVTFIAFRPRLRFHKFDIEFIWLGYNLSRFRVSEEPIMLLKAGKGTMRKGTYTPEGFHGGVIADYVPKGYYCHGPRPMKGSLCPFWDSDLARTEQNSGFCHVMNSGDWESGMGLLWDQCKECSYHDEDEDDEDESPT